MNAFAQYAETAIPEPAQRRQARAEKAPSALDVKMAEKQRLSKLYRAWRREVRTEAFAAEPRLRDFMRFLRTIKPQDGDELVEAVSSSWLPTSPQHVRVQALRLIDRHANRLIRQCGGEPLDDPLPPERNVYQLARDVLQPDRRP